MRLKALSHYNNDITTRFGDCILLYDSATVVVYDCGHTDHAQRVKSFLAARLVISQVHIVISHNDSDHTSGIVELLDYLHIKRYTVTVYSSLYLKHTEKILEQLDDERRTSKATKQHVLDTFDKIAEIVEKAEEYGFSVVDAIEHIQVASLCWIVGPREDEFIKVVAQAIEDDTITRIEGETVMNAASVQLKCKLDNGQTVLLCGDASPSYLHRLDSYDVIQLPHHGRLDNAQEIFEELRDPYSKVYFISDNTGAGANSGGSDDLVRFMKRENYSPALNTQKGEVNLPKEGAQGETGNNRPQGVKLGGVDIRRG